MMPATCTSPEKGHSFQSKVELEIPADIRKAILEDAFDDIDSFCKACNVKLDWPSRRDGEYPMSAPIFLCGNAKSVKDAIEFVMNRFLVESARREAQSNPVTSVPSPVTCMSPTSGSPVPSSPVLSPVSPPMSPLPFIPRVIYTASGEPARHTQIPGDTGEAYTHGGHGAQGSGLTPGPDQPAPHDTNNQKHTTRLSEKNHGA